jgi:hypothetical protein
VSWRSHHPPKVNDWTPNALKAIGSPGLTTPLKIASLRVSGFQDKGAIWRGEELYYFSIPTGVRHHQAHADHRNMFRVVYPDGTLSARLLQSGAHQQSQALVTA